MVFSARELLSQLYQTAIDAVDGRHCVQQWCRQSGYRPTHVIAIGKAAPAMLQGALDSYQTVQTALLISNAVNLPREFNHDKRLHIVQSAHPVPDASSLAAGDALLTFIASTPEDARLLFLISGGTSSMVEVLHDGYDLSKLQTINQRLLASGKNIHAINAWRKHFSRIKGGGLLSFLGERECRQLLISDVQGDDVSVIGSGLLVNNRHSADDDAFLNSILHTTHVNTCNRQIESSVVACLHDALNAAYEQALLCDVDAVLHQAFIDGEAEQQGRRLSAWLKSAVSGVHIFGGETTVSLPDKPGMGGRNQTLALAMCENIADTDICVLCAGTDGIDGNTQCAGALVTGDTAAQARQMGFDINEQLRAANAGMVLMATGDVFKPGPTQTNVMDIIIAYKRSG